MILTTREPAPEIYPSRIVVRGLHLWEVRQDASKFLGAPLGAFELKAIYVRRDAPTSTAVGQLRIAVPTKYPSVNIMKSFYRLSNHDQDKIPPSITWCGDLLASGLSFRMGKIIWQNSRGVMRITLPQRGLFKTVTPYEAFSFRAHPRCWAFYRCCCAYLLLHVAQPLSLLQTILGRI